MPEGSVLVELSVSLDGFVAGPNVDVDRPLGDGGDRLHDWMFSGRTPEEAEAFEVESFANVGALVMAGGCSTLASDPGATTRRSMRRASSSPIGRRQG